MIKAYFYEKYISSNKPEFYEYPTMDVLKY